MALYLTFDLRSEWREALPISGCMPEVQGLIPQHPTSAVITAFDRLYDRFASGTIELTPQMNI